MRWAEDGEVDALRAMHRCKKCGTAMDSYVLDATRKIHICGNNPDCDGYEIETGNFRLKGYDGPVVECDRCGSDMQLKTGRFGKFMACSNAECKNTRKILKNGDVAPPKEDPVPLPELKCSKSDAHFVLRDGAAGLDGVFFGFELLRVAIVLHPFGVAGGEVVGKERIPLLRRAFVSRGGEDGTSFVADGVGVPRPLAAPGRRLLTADLHGCPAAAPAMRDALT